MLGAYKANLSDLYSTQEADVLTIDIIYANLQEACVNWYDLVNKKAMKNSTRRANNLVEKITWYFSTTQMLMRTK